MDETPDTAYTKRRRCNGHLGLCCLCPSFALCFDGFYEEIDGQTRPTVNLSKTVVVPSRLYHQPENMDLLNKFLKSISYQEDRVKEVRDGDDFKNPKLNEVVLLPCIMASRAGSDFGAMFQNLDLDKAREYPHLNIVVFTPKAEFVNPSVLSSQERMGDEFKVGRMFDVYFYGEDIYKCETNTDAKKRVADLLK